MIPWVNYNFKFDDDLFVNIAAHIFIICVYLYVLSTFLPLQPTFQTQNAVKHIQNPKNESMPGSKQIIYVLK